MFCRNCGKELESGVQYCPYCGAAQSDNPAVMGTFTPSQESGSSKKSRGIALLLSALLGGLGIHRFYVGKIGTGVLYIFTCGLFGIGALIDLIMIACGSFKDADGKPLTRWDFN